ncbi:hypothetical protein CDAR_122081 [Caerostris darwini]|uniref:Uncharacterized protein n=1 Tax=Caerostris darwini TaxID=1538125 RepID=A0AAV4QZD5_9ARAC|nr:hypothetical protein CDAR_122081 [Caerostris darwini]
MGDDPITRHLTGARDILGGGILLENNCRLGDCPPPEESIIDCRIVLLSSKIGFWPIWGSFRKPIPPEHALEFCVLSLDCIQTQFLPHKTPGHQGIERRRKIRNEESGPNSTPLDLLEFKGLTASETVAEYARDFWVLLDGGYWGWFFFFCASCERVRGFPLKLGTVFGETLLLPSITLA